MPKCVKVGIIGGSGLDDPDILQHKTLKSVTTPYGRPSDDLMIGQIEGVDCVILPRHGRKHSITPGKINYRANIWALKEEGCTHIIATNATGSLQENIHPGDIVFLDSFFDRTQGRKQTFYEGEPESPPGVLHIPMHPAFSTTLRNIFIGTAKEMGIKYHPTGTCVVIEGPRFSSHAESSLFQKWGGSVINMTLIPEVVLAKEVGICYGTIAMATDYCAWRQGEESVNVADVVATFKKNVSKVTELIVKSIPKIPESDWEKEVNDLKGVISANIM